MKKLVLVAASLIAFNFATIAQADDAHPCKSLETACKAAGFVKGGAQGKRLFKDCIQPLTEGKDVAGIKVDDKDVQGCKMKIANMQGNAKAAH